MLLVYYKTKKQTKKAKKDIFKINQTQLAPETPKTKFRYSLSMKIQQGLTKIEITNFFKKLKIKKFNTWFPDVKYPSYGFVQFPFKKIKIAFLKNNNPTDLHVNNGRYIKFKDPSSNNNKKDDSTNKNQQNKE